MNFRKHAEPRILGFLIAPMVDILLVILVFFIVTWNFALSENELDVRVPTATKANEAQQYVGQAVIVRGDQAVDYKHIVDVLDICRQADIWNVAFATGKPEQ